MHVLICNTAGLRPESEGRGDPLGQEMRLEEIDQLARSLWAVAREEAEEAQIAVAWLARNQICDGRLTVRECCACLNALSARASYAAHLPPHDDFADASLCRAFAMTCLVWAGDRADPTEGATLAHRHDEAPAWADRAKGTALIGPWMFYRAR